MAQWCVWCGTKWGPSSGRTPTSSLHTKHQTQGPVRSSSVTHLILVLTQAQHFPSGSGSVVASIVAGEMARFKPANATAEDSYMVPRLC